MANKSYLEKLRDPRWQKMRLKVLERDGWCCQSCHDEKATLNVHHRYYIKDADPWDYPLEALLTLCEECHEEEKGTRSEVEKSLLHVLRQMFLSSEVTDLAAGFHEMELQHLPEVVATAYGWALGDPHMQKYLIDRYFEHLHETATQQKTDQYQEAVV